MPGYGTKNVDIVPYIQYAHDAHDVFTFVTPIPTVMGRNIW